MSNRDDLEHAAQLLERLLPHTTPFPWRDSSVDGNRYAALVSPKMHPDRPAGGGWEYDEDYGGCLVAESVTAGDRRLMSVLRNIADDLPTLLRALAEEDPQEVSYAAVGLAKAILDAHRPIS